MNKVLQMILFASFFSLITAVLHYYFWFRLVKDTGLPLPYRQWVSLAIVALGCFIPLGMIAGHVLSFPLGRLVTPVPLIWMGVMLLLFFGFFFTDLLRFVYFIFQKIAASADVGFAKALPVWPVRAVCIGVVALTALLSTIAVVKGYSAPAIVKNTISINHWPKSLPNFKIVQLTDIHLGLTLGADRLGPVVERVNGLQPDLVVITGDLVDGSVEALQEQAAPLRRLKAKWGVYFVTGNHEYYSGVGPWMKHLSSLGIKVLNNRSVAIGEATDFFYLAGVTDAHAARIEPSHAPDLDKALKENQPGKPVVLLAHQPLEMDNAIARKVDLMLSGHTHNGQIWPFTYLVRLQQPLVNGLHRFGATHIYVSPGTFYWGPPMRLGSSNEISLFTITGKDHDRNN